MSPLLFDSLHLFFHRHAANAKSTAQGRHPILVQQAAIVFQDAMSLSSQFPLQKEKPNQLGTAVTQPIYSLDQTTPKPNAQAQGNPGDLQRGRW